MSGHQPYEHVNPDGDPSLLILCDHATNIVPPTVNGGTLGLSPAEMERHIAFDVGARGVALELSALLGAPALLTRFSRLVIDPNRGEDDPTLVMRLYDGTIISANRHISAEEIERRKAAYHRPYHAAIRAAIDEVEARGETPVLVSIHSFTPQFKGRPLRPWHVGLLWDHDDRLLRPLLARLRAEDDLMVGDNEPYTGRLQGDCMWTHGTCRGLPHALIEIRNDLIADPDHQAAWAARLAPMIRDAVAELNGA